MKILFSVHGVLITALWFFGNGMLHDIFVLKQHQGPYNRELLRLLMDGHVLMLSGAVLFVCYLMMLNRIQCGATISIVIAAFMLLYTLLIFPFLKSFVTMGLSLWLILVSIKALQDFPNIYNIMQAHR